MTLDQNNTTNRVGQKQRTFYKISSNDHEWLLAQTDGVRILWLEAANADPFGKGGKFETKLKKSAFHVAKRTIEEYGAFQFERVQNQRDNRKTSCWKAFNLHGANNQDYWNGIESSKMEQNTNQKPFQEISSIHSGKMESNLQIESSQKDCISSKMESNSSETLSPFNSCPLLEYLDLNTIDLKLRNEKKESSCNERSDDGVRSSRSGCSNLDVSAKASTSDSAPDAQPTRVKELTPTFEKKDSEDLFAIAHDSSRAVPKSRITDLTDLWTTRESAKPTCCDTLVFCEHGLRDLVEDQEDNLPVQKMMDRCGQLDRRQNANRNAQDYATPQPEAPAPLLDSFAPPPQSDIEPPQPVPQPHLAPSATPFSSIYVSEVQKLALAGLLNSECRDRLPKFEKALNEGRLCSVIEGFTRTTGEFSFDPDHMVTDYLFNDVIEGELLVFVLSDDDRPILTPWSKL